ncbi:MAG: glycine cleavage system protein GcvH [Spirochaetaceae bacterium]|nr:glycine cleavage system protein GcvH [Spirochaetaceae bacterium]
MTTPEDVRYTRTHEWVRNPEGECEIGLTDYAQHELGDIVFVNLPQVGDPLKTGEAFGDIESVKAVSDIYSPLDGEVTAINEAVMDEPERVNRAPYETWLIKARGVFKEGGLISAEAYRSLTKK